MNSSLGRILITGLLVLVLLGSYTYQEGRWSVGDPLKNGGLASATSLAFAGQPLTTNQQAPDQGFASAIRQVSEKVRPAIVQITSSQQQDLGISNQAAPQPTGVGSGVIFDQAGYILTNNHVVSGAAKLTIALPDGRTFDGTVTGGDPQTDLAVVKISGDNLPVAQLGDSSQLSVGDWVVAIGNSLALPGGPTVTAGVVGALGRSIQEPGDTPNSAGPFLYDLIQTDAAINPGNSGGALTNLAGQVVGINTLVAGIAEPGVQAQGIGFAIAVNSAKPIAQQLMSTGRVVHPFIGISYGALSPSIAARLGIKDGNGAIISLVVPGSPAATAGLQRLDVIRQIDGQNLVDESSLGRVMATKKPGDQIILSVDRGNQSMQIKLTLGERPTGS